MNSFIVLEPYSFFLFLEFSLNDFPKEIRDQLQETSNVTYCYYKGFRHGSHSQDKYEVNDTFYYSIATCLLFVIIFEVKSYTIKWILCIKYLLQHLLLILTGLLAYAIPDMPFIIKEHLAHDDKMIHALRQEAKGY